MALTATVHHFKIDLSDVDRGVYEALDLRVAQHPSESTPFLLTRVLAYCLLHQEGLSFSKGLSSTDEPALWAHDLQGNLRLWVEVGTPSAERLHRASKAAPRLVVFTHHDPELLKRAARAREIHKVDAIEVYALDGSFLEALAAVTTRNARWEVVHTEGTLYVTSQPQGEQPGGSVSGQVQRHRLGAE